LRTAAVRTLALGTAGRGLSRPDAMPSARMLAT
jgi:hypothetical protein